MATKALQSGAVPLFERVKSHVLERVVTGELRTHDRVLSENELVREFGVSRMSVNRALKDLTAEGVLVRTPGVGTFVAPSRPQAHPLQIRNIADEITARGHKHRAMVVSSETVTAGTEQARELNCPRLSRRYRIRLDRGFGADRGSGREVDEPEAGAGADIVVTAQRRSESIQRVPIRLQA